MAGTIVSATSFTQFLVDQQPVYDKYIIEDIRPSDGWVAHVTSGTFAAWSGTQHTRDRFNHVYPDTTQTWNPVNDSSCVGTPCDPNETAIGWGSTRLIYGLEQQSWQTQLLCFDQDMHITHAREQFRYIISKILKPATIEIQNTYLRKRGAILADNKFIANSSFGNSQTQFVFNFVVVGTQEIYIDTNCPNTNVYKLTPQMLQRMVEPLLRIGYLGENPFKEQTPPMLELVTDTQTIWELDRLGGQQGIGGTPSITGNWRFTEWDAANKYWRYGFSGQIGNYAGRIDPTGLRFNFVGLVAGSLTASGNYRYQVVLPYKNIPSSGAGSASGLRSIANIDFDNAQYAFSYVWHAKGIEMLVAEAMPVNPEMPFASRNFGGKWQFVMDNLGADASGVVIQNKRRNKGQFIADFKQAAAPNHTEFLCLIFHKREPACIIQISTCNADPGYPTQSYSSADPNCTSTGNTLLFTPQLDTTTNTYEVLADTITCNNETVEHAAITGASTVTTLVAQLNANVSILGTWTVVGAQVQLVGPCLFLNIPWKLS